MWWAERATGRRRRKRRRRRMAKKNRLSFFSPASEIPAWRPQKELISMPYPFCTFYLDGLLLGVELKSVQDVIRSLDVTRVPLAPGVVSGLINLRGQIVTAVDLRRRLELAARAPGAEI